MDKNFLEVLRKDLFIVKRQYLITEDYINSSVKIYNGIRFYDLTVTDKMLGHKFGEFSPTRKIPKHPKQKKKKK
jgi:small subunit ribosomal protein S19